MTGFAPTQAPAWQVWLWVQASPPLPVVPFGFRGLEQVQIAGSRTPASWHCSRAAQTTGFDPSPASLRDALPILQASPSVQAVPFALAGLEQVPLAGSQVPAS